MAGRNYTIQLSLWLTDEMLERIDSEVQRRKDEPLSLLEHCTRQSFLRECIVARLRSLELLRDGIVPRHQIAEPVTACRGI
jgi:hypothetical protein